MYLTADEKYAAIIADIKESMKQGRPVLVGTATIETSEHMSNLLKRRYRPQGAQRQVPRKEAEIIAQAGAPGALTIATNMAGRGTDILLGGNWEAEVAALENPSAEQIAQIKADWQKRHQQVIEAGGLHVIASERHESRRIDNQLRGRAGRQGDPGSSRFYLSLEDSLMRIFASDRVKNFMKALGMQSGEAIEHRMVTNAIEKAQRKVEGRNFDIRKQLLEYDDVANEQRKVIYHMRNSLLAAENIGDTISEFRREVLDATISQHIPPQSLPEQWDVAGLEAALASDFAIKLPIQQWLDEDERLYEETLREKLLHEITTAYNEKEDQAGIEALRTFEKQILLRVLDDLWKDHLSTMDHLRHGIHLRGYAQKNPKQEYKRESFTLFQNCWSRSSAIPSACFPTSVFAARIRPKKRPVCAAKPRNWLSACSSSMLLPLAWKASSSSPRKAPRWLRLPRRYATSRSWVATSHAGAVRARSSSTATARSSDRIALALTVDQGCFAAHRDTRPLPQVQRVTPKRCNLVIAALCRKGRIAVPLFHPRVGRY